MKAKSILSNVLLAVGWIYISIQIYYGFVTGELNGIGRGSRIISKVDDPILFVVVMTMTIIFNIVLLFLGLYFIYGVVDRKVKAYGGNYNIKTAKAIIRGFRK